MHSQATLSTVISGPRPPLLAHRLTPFLFPHAQVIFSTVVGDTRPTVPEDAELAGSPGATLPQYKQLMQVRESEGVLHGLRSQLASYAVCAAVQGCVIRGQGCVSVMA